MRDNSEEHYSVTGEGALPLKETIAEVINEASDLIRRKCPGKKFIIISNIDDEKNGKFIPICSMSIDKDSNARYKYAYLWSLILASLFGSWFPKNSSILTYIDKINKISISSTDYTPNEENN